MQQDDKDRDNVEAGGTSSAESAATTELAALEASRAQEGAAGSVDTAAPSSDRDGEPQVLAVEGETASRPSARRQLTSDDKKASSDDKGDVEGEDDETWTNLPNGGSDVDSHVGDDDDSEDDEDDAPVVTRKVIQNARDVICEELPARAERAKLRLRPQLTGAFLIEVSNTGEKFIFDWRGQDPKVTPAEGPVELAPPDSNDPSKVDTIISLSDQHMMAIRSGDLNPQVAMLADKIRVKGKMGPAVYLFNLVAPRVRD